MSLGFILQQPRPKFQPAQSPSIAVEETTTSSITGSVHKSSDAPSKGKQRWRTDSLVEDGHGVSVDDEFAVLGLHGALEPAVRRVVLEHVHLWEQRRGVTICWNSSQKRCLYVSLAATKVHRATVALSVPPPQSLRVLEPLSVLPRSSPCTRGR